MNEKGKLWSSVLISKYGGLRGLEREEMTPDTSIWWRDLNLSCRRACESSKVTSEYNKTWINNAI